MTDFKVGDRVRRVSGHHNGMSRGALGTVNEVTGHRIKLDEYPGSGYHDDEMFEPITNKGDAPMARKTYKLIRDTPTTKQGAIYQEACDDGTQEYVLLDQGFLKGTGAAWGGRSIVTDRSLVEDQPKWFVEVFAVTPQHMTAPELERWEAFKAVKPTKVAPKVKAAVKAKKAA